MNPTPSSVVRIASSLVTLLALASACRGTPRLDKNAALPVLQVTHDDTVITQSCWVEIPPSAVIADTNGNGVIHIGADGITIRFRPGSVLRGADPATPWDQLKGIGIRLNGHEHVTVDGAQVHGFHEGFVASNANGLVVSGGDFSDNYRQHLKSTPAAEDGADWLFPHHNDEQLWRDEYGGALCVERSSRVTIHDVRIRRGQNGIVLDRVEESAVYDNDCSFLSGWGLALWRSSRNTISRNAFDFCVRGHSEGIYNRGQDSAGILCFEQCNDNVFAENSVTHGGDGLFGFAGHEAIGETWMNQERERLRKETGKSEVDDLIHPPEELVRRLSPLGCNRNLFWRNDFSYASAHGLEMTFSEGNQLVENRFVENGICGFWGGYSSDTVIVGNEFSGNGGMAYGLERGAINMEHAAGSLITGNQFVNNKAAIHLWWNQSGLMKFPGVSGMERGVTGNIIVSNRFEITEAAPFARLGRDEKLVILQLRDQGRGHVVGNQFHDNTLRLTHAKAVEQLLDPGTEPALTGAVPHVTTRSPRILGTRHPVGARVAWRGRSQIVMDDWGPWDHESPLLRRAGGASGAPEYELFGVTNRPTVQMVSGNVVPELVDGTPMRLRLRGRPGPNAYRIRLSVGEWKPVLSGSFLQVDWRVTFFPWTPTTDPREHLAAWRALATGPDAVSTTLSTLDLPYGMGGPRSLGLSEDVRRRGPGNDHFGTIAETHVPLPAGRWRVTTLSDDGVRVSVNGRPVLENWGWHGPTTDMATFDQPATSDVELKVEHFEIDGFSTLRVQLEPVIAP